MAFKNLMEDIVTNVVNKILFKEDRKLLEYEPYKQDIITFVLNRMPPKYYTSERGILHGKLDSEFTFQEKADILLLTYEAIKLIKSRRDTELPGDTTSDTGSIFCLPHILGEVLEETTFSIIPDIKIHLLYKGKTARMKDSTWKNPYITSKATEGYYHFWPEIPEELENDICGESVISFELVFSHPDFKEKKITESFNVLSTVDIHRSQTVPITLIQIAEGADLADLT